MPRRRSARRTQASKVTFMMRSVRRKSRARRASPASIGLAPPTFAASICWRAMRSMKTARKVASCTERPAASRPWCASSSACFAPSAAAISSPSRSAVGRPGQSREERGVVEQRRRVHVGDDQRLLGGGERRRRRRMGVDDRLDVGARAIDPEVKARRRVGLADAERAGALAHVERVVDEQPRRGLGLVECEAERQRPEGAVFGSARGQLAGEAGLVALVGEDPGAARQRGARIGRQRRRGLAQAAAGHVVTCRRRPS